MASEIGNVLAFWGKARPDAAEATVTWHPVVYHLLDVAAAADAILAVRPLALRRAARLLGLTPTDARRLIVALVALHDLGKFAPAFQAKSLEHWPAALAGLDPAQVAPTHHTGDGYALWHHVLGPGIAERLWSGGRRTLDVLAPAIFGHHGRPVRSADARAPVDSIFRAGSRRMATTCADAVLSLLLPVPIDAPPPSEQQARIASWWVSGLTTVADWIGSNQRWFPYTAPDPDLAAYWSHARECACRAIAAAGVGAPRPSPLKSFTELTKRPTPSPAQAWASSVALPDGPVLVIIEDVTGAGKTEAAQMLVHRLMADGRADGAYWAMPTQATANAMYARQADAVHALFERDRGAPPPSVVLAHGQSRLHDGFRATVLRDPAERLDAAARRESGLPADAACAAFLADDRRAALLADVGAGTVDQALLGALPSRFNTVRLFGLVDKVLVFDEAHAYDPYVGVEVQQLLRFQAALGGSAVILSATLSRAQRQTFATAWTEGLDEGRRRIGPLFGGDPPPLVQSQAYPLATVVSADAEPVREYAIEAAEWSRRSVGVRFVRTVEDACAHVVEWAGKGAAVAWVRNTVDDCLTAAAMARAAGFEPIVFHARFAQADRQAREARVLELFGERGSAAERRGAVLIATQVVEQSLDLDFDVLVTDLAPVDLLIQRAGRLQRHPARDAERPTGLARELVVLAPSTDGEPAKDWLTAVLPKTRYVYEDVGVLWRTAVALGDARVIDTPGGLRALVEAVYGSNETPEALLPVAQAARGKDLGQASAANHAVLELADGYHGDLKGWVDDIRPMTRLGDEQTTVRLARVRADGALAPWAEVDGPAWKAWALSEVRLSAARVPFGSTPSARYQAAVEAVRGEWGRFEQEITVLPLLPRDGEPDTWDGALLKPDGRLVSIVYTRAQGLGFAERDADA
ncbi:MAG TPA: CRISPR-associated helicase Cas3' [Gemmatimonadaceae bacterium]|nr:CRISPR-associated helicase Cas3' [Gemmatimonadaceae bacterium]